ETLDTGLGGFTTGGAVSTNGNLYTTTFDAGYVVVFSAVPPHPILQSIETSLHGGGKPEDIVFADNGDFYVTHVVGNGNIQRYDSAGVHQQDYGTSRSDWMDLAADQTTMFFTIESPNIKRWDLATNDSFPDFANIGGTKTYAFRLLAPFDGSG